MGVRLTVATNRPELLAAAAAACRGWEGEPDEAGARLRLGLEVGSVGRGDGETETRVDGRSLRISGGRVDAYADSVTGSAHCVVTEDRLADRAAFLCDVLDPLLLFLLTRSGRAPVHAAGFMAGDLVILLAGPSGSGKSCLALAAHEAGFRLLSDDIVYVQLRPRLRVWGIPRPIHVFPEDAPAGRKGGALRLRNGKLKRAVPVEAGATAATARRAVLCLLERGAEVSIESISPAEAMSSLEFEPGFDLLRGDIEQAFAALAMEGAWRLTLSAEPAEAISLLSRKFGPPGATARQ